MGNLGGGGGGGARLLTLFCITRLEALRGQCPQKEGNGPECVWRENEWRWAIRETKEKKKGI